MEDGKSNGKSGNSSVDNNVSQSHDYRARAPIESSNDASRESSSHDVTLSRDADVTACTEYAITAPMIVTTKEKRAKTKGTRSSKEPDGSLCITSQSKQVRHYSGECAIGPLSASKTSPHSNRHDMCLVV